MLFPAAAPLSPNSAKLALTLSAQQEHQQQAD
jgi:hypothetical protein